MEPINEVEERAQGVLESFANPSTFPHLILMILISGFLYLMMKIEFFGVDEKGSIIFLSLTISYIIAAIINPSKVGKLLLNVDHEGKGIFNFQYWKKSARVLLSIATICLIVSMLLITQLGEYNSKVIVFMSSLFLLMSLGQALSIIYGGIQYSNGRKLEVRESNSSRLATAFRAILIVLAFSPLVWWIEYTSGGSSEEITYLSFNWILQLGFLISLGLIVIFVDSVTSEKRRGESVDGRAVDRFMMFVIATCCWHLFSAWRRNPFVQDPSQTSILIEEGLLMSITIVLAVWSISNRGKAKGWKIFQGQSAMFWGVSFGYAYGGSIASLSSISGGFLDLVTITAMGHLITAVTIILMLPITIGLVGFVKSEDLASEEPMKQEQVGVRVDNEVGESEKPDFEDIVELVD
ncbi:MAG: hypothetical protein CMA88_01140 [Euryarchaeota archaeon]|nr:hypothetical protein [Euryarchaeota archaeon]